jgi:hypothetical protein
MNEAFVRLTTQSLKKENFTLVDVGCSGGIEPAWRTFGDRLKAVGFDASLPECRRLEAAETHPNIRYVPGFVDIPRDHPFYKRAEGKPPYTDELFRRFSVSWSLEMRAKCLAGASHAEKMAHNLWHETELADQNTPIFVPDELRKLGTTDVDFLKIDIDGPDFRVLNSFDGLFAPFGILAARLEVCMFGDADDTLHTFHNTDRFMRQQGYALIAIEPRTYSMRALPSRYTNTEPAQTVSGRLFLADALYARDPAGFEEWKGLADTLSDEKLLKLAAIHSVWSLPDGAADILVTFRSRLHPLVDINRALDLLAAQAQPNAAEPLSYRDYMALFASDSPAFYPPYTPPPRRTVAQRLLAAWRALRD